jgi:uncharacterized OB-fold protein
VVQSYTTCTEDNEGKPLPQPVGVALVRFPSAHGGLVHKTKGEVSVGDKVRVVFKEKSKRTGSILDIEYFEKVG